MTKPQHLTLPSASQDDHESIHTPLLQPTTSTQNEEDDSLSSSYCTATSQEPPTILISSDVINNSPTPISNNSEEGDQDLRNASTMDTNKIRLPIPLLILFGLYGLTLSLPTLPFMYILNTRVALPLSLLPTYGALAFLPFSFKPLYAYWSSAFSRRFLLAVGWVCCAVTSVGWTVVSSTTGVFVMGISNGIAMAWSGFLLGLTLLDQATRQEHIHQQYLINNNNSHAETSTTTTTTSFQKAASLFQSQAATARNVGSFGGSLLTCLVFGMSHSKSKMNNQVTNALLWTTAACHMISFLVICLGRTTFASAPSATTNDIQNTNEERPFEQSTDNDNNIRNTPRSRHPSYSSMEACLGNDDEGGTPEEETQSIISQQSPLPSLASTQALPWDKNIILIGTLQVSLILLALKGPILDLFAHHPHVGPILGGMTLTTMSFLAARLYYVSSSSSTPWKLSHMVGLVLMLRHAIPSTSSILSAFLYQCLKNQPVWLQIFSLVDNGVVTLSSWSYQKLWATRYSHGRKLIHFMMITTLVASLVEYLYVALVRTYNEENVSWEEIGGNVAVADDDDDSMMPSRMRVIFPWMVLAVKVVDTFIGEWNFLPDVVLATVSVTIPTTTGTLASGVPSSIRRTNEDLDVEQQQPGQQPLTAPVVAPAASGVEYGSLISCIDFGDQLGNILATPIVSLLGITRENGWKNLDVMIQICVGLGIMSVGILTLLLSWFPRDVAPTSRGSSVTGRART